MRTQREVKLADRIVAGARPSAYITRTAANMVKLKQSHAGLIAVLSKTTLFEIDSIAALMEEMKAYHLWSDLPPMAIPFNNFWMEYLMPIPEIREIASHIGVFFEARMFEPNQKNFGQVAATFIKGLPEAEQDKSFIAVQEKLRDFWKPNQSIWLCCPSVYSFNKAQNTYTTLGNIVFVVNQNGAPLADFILQEPTISPELNFHQGEDCREKLCYQMESAVSCVLLALAFLNCKNVKVEQQEPNPKLSKAFQKRHGRPLLRYHTLEIEPMKQVLETEGGVSQNGLKKALHICRGHFATYTPDKPLFGNFIGTVWKPAHTRGSLSNGAVVKDYKIKAPIKESD